MATKDNKEGGLVSIFGGIIVIVTGIWIRSKADDFTGDWPEVVSIGCFIVGIISIVIGSKKLKKQ